MTHGLDTFLTTLLCAIVGMLCIVVGHVAMLWLDGVI